ncbi:class I SAM-dependent methyltransferase [uncultured Croceitalea sp.]|uniref:class I SAM-dependent methyltransferase n=1 Tax=uncultured Croceitalea sp. TaxID=1798908 RepID=UPI003306902D
MKQIYEQKLWGKSSATFYSGEGSHDPKIINPYLTAVTEFLTSFENPITVCDLGCGDFNVGAALVKHTKKYIAVDIVPGLIEYNKEKFKADNLEFHCLDIAAATLPFGDCAILRQVLQHLSNAEVAEVVSKLSQYKYVLLTEHIPNEDFIPNKDIISGQGIRLKKLSGINLLAPPFNLKVKEERVLSSFVLENKKGRIETRLYKV